jgi:probable rRNA maturation factor
MIIARTRFAGMNGLSIGRFVAKARRSIPIRGLVNVLVATSGEMKSLNARFRGKDETTDVLSFPTDGIDGLAGEIAISFEIAKENAEKLGHSTADEIKILILHGMLHIAGYDHENDHGEMSREEQRLREVLRLPVGLIERNNSIAIPGKESRKAKAALAAGMKR